MSTVTLFLEGKKRRERGREGERKRKREYQINIPASSYTGNAYNQYVNQQRVSMYVCTHV